MCRYFCCVIDGRMAYKYAHIDDYQEANLLMIHLDSGSQLCYSRYRANIEPSFFSLKLAWGPAKHRIFAIVYCSHTVRSKSGPIRSYSVGILQWFTIVLHHLCMHIDCVVQLCDMSLEHTQSSQMLPGNLLYMYILNQYFI